MKTFERLIWTETYDEKIQRVSITIPSSKEKKKKRTLDESRGAKWTKRRKLYITLFTSSSHINTRTYYCSSVSLQFSGSCCLCLVHTQTHTRTYSRSQPANKPTPYSLCRWEFLARADDTHQQRQQRENIVYRRTRTHRRRVYSEKQKE